MPAIPIEHYAAFFNDASIGLAVCRRDNGEYLTVNKAFAKILGRSVDETLRLSYWQITPMKYKALEAEQLHQLDTTKQYGPYEKEYIHANGDLVPVRLSGKIIRAGEIDYIWSLVEDLRNEKYRILFQEASLGLALRHAGEPDRR